MESWPVTSPPYAIDHAQVKSNLSNLRLLMAEHQLDAMVINSADRYQNEYTPLEDNHRYELSGFTGSTALMLVPANDRARLYVDGRYHLQADQEVDADLIEVVKVRFSVSVSGAVFEDLKNLKKVGYEGDRVSVTFSREIDQRVQEACVFSSDEVGQALGRPALIHEKPVSYIPGHISGRSTKEKLDVIFSDILDREQVVLLVTALDDIAWLSDGRGYHFAYQSSFAATALARPNSVHVSVDPEVARQAEDRAEVLFCHDQPEDLLSQKEFAQAKVLQFDPNQVTRGMIEKIKKARPDLHLREKSSPIVSARALKTPSEIEHMEESNARSSQAIANTIRWVRQQFADQKPVTELEYYEAANQFYSEQGARDLSFHTIAAVGSNTAIIHFSNPSSDVLAQENDFMLLDSGALYEGGLATDITRCFVAGGAQAAPSARQKTVYTVALKGLLRGMMAVFPKGTKGSFLDSLVRAPLYQAGYDFAHGTGHGVGIHVHEPGVGISPSYQGIIRAGHVCSIEPGIYIEGFGGVRHENVVVFEEHPEQEGFLRSRPLNYVAFDTCLIERALLNEEELSYFDDYMDVCRARGTARLA